MKVQFNFIYDLVFFYLQNEIIAHSTVSLIIDFLKTFSNHDDVFTNPLFVAYNEEKMIILITLAAIKIKSPNFNTDLFFQIDFPDLITVKEITNSIKLIKKKLNLII